jgi:hypothetical protein
MLIFLLDLQIFQVAFLLLHDWIPLGPLNDPGAVRSEHPPAKMLLGTSISTLPFAIALGYSLHSLHHPWPRWLFIFLWIAYAFLFAGELEAWWVPYFFGTKPERVASYDRMFGATHAFLPARHGIRVNTLHVILHATTLATLVVLATLTL